MKEFKTNGGKNRKTHLLRASEILRRDTTSLRMLFLNPSLEIILARAKNSFISYRKGVTTYLPKALVQTKIESYEGATLDKMLPLENQACESHQFTVSIMQREWHRKARVNINSK